MPDALAAAFERRVRDDEPTVVRIRRLELDLVLDCGGSPAELAERWAVAITRALGDALEREGPNTVRFASHA